MNMNLQLFGGRGGGGSSGKTRTPRSLPKGAQQINGILDVLALQRQMGQTGDEAGRVGVPRNVKEYVGTSKAYNINTYLYTDGATMHSPQSGWDDPSKVARFPGCTASDALTETKVKKMITKIDSGMKPLPNDVQVTRFVEPNALGSYLGNSNINSSTFGSLMSTLNTQAGRDSFAKQLRGTQTTNKAYTSTSWVNDHPSFANYQIRLRGVAKAGTKAIVTNNRAEHEILLGRGTKFNFTGGFEVKTTSTGRQQLVLDVIYT